MKNAPASIRRSASFILLAMAAASAGAADSYKAPRTSWGHPAIQGVYSSNTDVPFERARELGDKAFFTEAEYQARKSARPTAEAETTPGTAADVHYSTEEFGLNPDQ